MKEMIHDGSLAQLLIILLVWGTVALLLGVNRPVPDALFDAGLIIVGFFFGSKTAAARFK